MSQRTWFITGVSSGFGRQITEQLLNRGDRVIGTVRDTGKVADLLAHHPEAFFAEVLDVTDTAAIRDAVDRSFTRLGRIDVFISNAGYGLFGAAEELTDKQVEHMVATNLVGSIQLIRSALPHLRAQGGGRIIQISSYGGQVAFPGNSMYHATKWGIDTYKVATNVPTLTQRETWEALDAKQALHRIMVFDANGTGKVTVEENIPIPTQQ